MPVTGSAFEKVMHRNGLGLMKRDLHDKCRFPWCGEVETMCNIAAG